MIRTATRDSHWRDSHWAAFSRLADSHWLS
jgi:hypothetical protein